MNILYPTVAHERAARKIVELFAGDSSVAAVLLINSCARNKATADSCLDIALLLAPDCSPGQKDALRAEWERRNETEAEFRDLRGEGKFSHVDLGVIDGRFDPARYPHDWTSGPDGFELAVGNFVRYAVPLHENGGWFAELKRTWLPYYGDELRSARLKQSVVFLRNNLDHIPPYVERGLVFQSFERLYLAHKEFLQALFQARRVYPIAYDKWIREQVADILGLPRLYERLLSLLVLPRLDGETLLAKRALLEELVKEYVAPSVPG
jgi:hypothetical protein